MATSGHGDNLSCEQSARKGLGETVAQHYNNLEEKGKEHRKESRIYYMRNFNNWTKSMLIQQYADKVKESRPELQRSRGQFHGHDRNHYNQGGNYGHQSHQRNYDNRGGHGYQRHHHGQGYGRPPGDYNRREDGDNRERYDDRNYQSRDREEKESNVDNQFSVLDLACGKGGDMLKWSKAGVDHVTCVDIAETSVQQAKDRYNQMKQRNRGRIFKANFFAADCTKTRLLEKYQNSPKFDIVSCQFAFHYSFETQSQAECMVRNAAECLKPGGYFIGTTPDANIIWQRLKSEHCNHFGNSVYSVEFDQNSPLVTAAKHTTNENETQGKITGKMPKDLQTFGVGYNFHLEGVVDCPEFLVNFDALCDIADRHGLVLAGKQGFENFFKEKRNTREGANLLRRINALEPYPPNRGVELVGDGDDSYSAAKAYLEKLKTNNETESHSKILPDKEPIFELENRPGRDFQIGTLSKEEWEAITFYCVFAFKKKKN